jgi:hypothetical protein
MLQNSSKDSVVRHSIPLAQAIGAARLIVATLIQSVFLLGGNNAQAASTILGFPEGLSCGVWRAAHREYRVNARPVGGWLLGYVSRWADTLSSAPASAVVSQILWRAPTVPSRSNG